MQVLSILGATGSIGESTIDVVLRHPEQFRVAALSGHRNLERLAVLIERTRPQVVAVAHPQDIATLCERLPAGLRCTFLHGPQALIDIATLPEVTTVMAAIVGAAGLPATIAAATAGKRVLLANKEALVMAGALFMQAVKQGQATLLPIDSEHSAVFQSLPREYLLGDPQSLSRCGVRRIVLTASGGPFRTLPLAQMPAVTPAQAVAHPNWVMGRKISVDSATMMNKGLEVIEAHWLFAAPLDRIEVVIHPQSVIHSMVEYCDGSVMAQLGQPDMRTPIACALAYPRRIDAGVPMLDFLRQAPLEFSAVDAERYPCVGLAAQAIRSGGTAPALLNAANEVAVEAFLGGRIGFTRIAATIASVLDACPAEPLTSLDVVYAADRLARARANAEVARNERVSV
jgi:1-deoxy-D-xylulose-5-phosphate reductoisomerase